MKKLTQLMSRELPVRFVGAALLISVLSNYAEAQTIIEPKITTETVNTAFLTQQDDVSAVTQVVMRERQGREHGWWDQLMSTFWPDSRVDLSWYHGDGPGFVYASRKLFSAGQRGANHIAAPVIDMHGTRAHVEASAHNWTLVKVDGKDANLYIDMLLNYRLEKRSGEWRILSFNAIYQHCELTPAVPGETLNVPAAELAKYRAPYALLAWALGKNGRMTITQDELAIDRPDQVDAFYASIKKWLNQ